MEIIEGLNPKEVISWETINVQMYIYFSIWFSFLEWIIRRDMCSGNTGWLNDWMDDSAIAKHKIIL